MADQKKLFDTGEASDDSNGPRAKKERAVQKHWFDEQSEKKQNEIIKSHFDEAHPTNDDIKKAVQDYDNQ